mmetsp:Transcript_2836/g.8767  ORF Transcript_2836/g.8767 Transcript_2836/m.8767 type:complete len:456 (+) Transcript_2836:468-1835(+)
MSSSYAPTSSCSFESSASRPTAVFSYEDFLSMYSASSSWYWARRARSSLICGASLPFCARICALISSTTTAISSSVCPLLSSAAAFASEAFSSPACTSVYPTIPCALSTALSLAPTARACTCSSCSVRWSSPYSARSSASAALHFLYCAVLPRRLAAYFLKSSFLVESAAERACGAISSSAAILAISSRSRLSRSAADASRRIRTASCLREIRAACWRNMARPSSADDAPPGPGPPSPPIAACASSSWRALACKPAKLARASRNASSPTGPSASAPSSSARRWRASSMLAGSSLSKSARCASTSPMIARSSASPPPRRSWAFASRTAACSAFADCAACASCARCSATRCTRRPPSSCSCRNVEMASSMSVNESMERRRLSSASIFASSCSRSSSICTIAFLISSGEMMAEPAFSTALCAALNCSCSSRRWPASSATSSSANMCSGISTGVRKRAR